MQDYHDRNKTLIRVTTKTSPHKLENLLLPINIDSIRIKIFYRMKIQQHYRGMQ